MHPLRKPVCHPTQFWKLPLQLAWAGTMSRPWSGPCWTVRAPWTLCLLGSVVKDSTASRGMWSPSPCPCHSLEWMIGHVILLSAYSPTQLDGLIGFCILLVFKLCKCLPYLTLKTFDGMLVSAPPHIIPKISQLSQISQWSLTGFACLFDHHLCPDDTRERRA